jgi:hypothetical protein
MRLCSTTAAPSGSQIDRVENPLKSMGRFKLAKRFRFYLECRKDHKTMRSRLKIVTIENDEERPEGESLN